MGFLWLTTLTTTKQPPSFQQFAFSFFLLQKIVYIPTSEGQRIYQQTSEGEILSVWLCNLSQLCMQRTFQICHKSFSCINRINALYEESAYYVRKPYSYLPYTDKCLDKNIVLSNSSRSNDIWPPDKIWTKEWKLVVTQWVAGSSANNIFISYLRNFCTCEAAWSFDFLHTSYLSFCLHMAHFWLQFFSSQKARKSRQNRFHGKTV